MMRTSPFRLCYRGEHIDSGQKRLSCMLVTCFMKWTKGEVLSGSKDERFLQLSGWIDCLTANRILSVRAHRLCGINGGVECSNCRHASTRKARTTKIHAHLAM